MGGTFLSELKKALTSTGDGAALIPYDLDAMLHEELLRIQPLAELMSVLQAEGKTHEYNVRSSHPLAWFEGEVTPAAPQNSVYARRSVQLKIQRIWGSVTGFAQAVDERFIDALEAELVGSLEGLANIMEYGALFGAADDIGFTGDAYQYSGILPRVYKYAPGNVIDAGGDKISLDDLDAAVAKAAGYRQVRNDPRLWFMSLRMKQVVDGLQSKVQLPLQTVTLADGRIEMAAYAGAPIFESDNMAPDTSASSPTPTTALAAGGSLADAVAVNYKISSVTAFGEREVGAAGTSRTPGTGNNTVNLTWTADPAAKLYMVWRQDGGTGDYLLLDIIPAKTYDASGTVNGSVEAYSDAGAKTPIVGIKPLASGEQQILLANLNPLRGAAFVGMVDDMGRQIGTLASFVETARVKDTYDYFLKSYLSLRLVHPNLFAVVRHAKLA